jgi:hypothetical protein
VLLNVVDMMIDQMAPVNKALKEQHEALKGQATGLEKEIFGNSGHTR